MLYKSLQNGQVDIIYLRLSLEDGDVADGTAEESCSIQSQRTCIHQFLKEHGIPSDSVEEIVDDGHSGTNLNRPGMQRLLRMVERGQVRTIIVRDLSRFARNYLEAGHYLEFVFPAYDVRFISINDQFDSQEIGETTGGLELAIKNLINQMYSKDISRKIKSAVDIKKMNGEYVYGTAPYGYKKGPVKNTIVVDEPAALIVKQIFTWAASGVTITQIAQKFNSQGTPTPSAYLAPVRGPKYKVRKIWTFESVRNILDNRIYTGDTVPFKSHVIRIGSDRVKQIPEELRTVIPNTHEAIISRELYYQARTVIKSTKKSKSTTPPNPLTSLLVCGCCGNRLGKGKAQNKNWTCTTHRYHPELDCKDVRFNDEKLSKIVMDAVMMQCRLTDARVNRIRKESQLSKSTEQILQTECRTLRQKIEHLSTEKMQRYEAYVLGQISKQDFVRIKQDIVSQEEKAKLELEIAEQKLSELNAKICSDAAQEKDSQQILQYQDITELTPELTRELIKRITIFPDGSLKIQWNFHDDISDAVDFTRIASDQCAG